MVKYFLNLSILSENSHFAQDNFGVVPILNLRRTYILPLKIVVSFLEIHRKETSVSSKECME